MVKKLFFKLLILILILIISFYIVSYTFDPFGHFPKGTSPNCGPENRYKFDVIINSKEDFVNFIKNSDGKILDNHGNNWVELDNFKNIQNGMRWKDVKSLDVDWNKVLSEVKIKNVGFKKISSLNYNPYGCSGFTLKMTKNGHVSVYGCCGI